MAYLPEGNVLRASLCSLLFLYWANTIGLLSLQVISLNFLWRDLQAFLPFLNMQGPSDCPAEHLGEGRIAHHSCIRSDGKAILVWEMPYLMVKQPGRTQGLSNTARNPFLLQRAP